MPGGAERLVVNAALALQAREFDVVIYTTHHQPPHCFPETTGDGPLAANVRVAGAWIPVTLFGRFHVFLAMLRMCYLALVALLLDSADVYFVDQVSTCIPLLRLFRKPVLFYCHFPDKLLCVDRSSWLKRAYRWPMDRLEEVTTGLATRCVCNSRFTRGVFSEHFPSLASRAPGVLYPAIDLPRFDAMLQREMALPAEVFGDGGRDGGGDGDAAAAPILLVSVNRYERKKNIALAIHALAELREQLPAELFARLRFVHAGGYDTRVRENVEHFAELRAEAEAAGVEEAVTLMRSVADDVRTDLMRAARVVLYTPDREHFGIVPLEAMYCGAAVIAVNSGGPLETVQDGVTGFLRPPRPAAWAAALKTLLQDDGSAAAAMGRAGHDFVLQTFSLDAFGDALQQEVMRCLPIGCGKSARKLD
eukprot:PLAT5406.2.p2 GENE.PLAT5406.2~~PLAT5406.2.p2  ORF type:complete len:420 (-),score=204.61 PLAT5406.2:53-1312(-)